MGIPNIDSYLACLCACSCVQIIYVKLSVVMGLGWVLGFVAAFTDWPVLWYAFIVVNSLQGAMLCAAFVVTRQVMRMLADCITSLRRRAVTGTSNDQSLKPPARETPGPDNSDAVMTSQVTVTFNANIETCISESTSVI